MSAWRVKPRSISGLLFGLMLVGGCGSSLDGSSSTEIAIAGKILADGAANANITVTVGGFSAGGSADANGRYFITVSVPDASDGTPVELFARLAGERAFVELASHLGSIRDVRDGMGQDGTLSFSDNPRVNISSLSTVELAFLREFGLVRSKSLNLPPGIDPQAALDLAGSVELLLQGSDKFQLPDATSTTLELASNRQVRENFVQNLKNVHYRDWQSATASILGSAEILATADDIHVDHTILALDRPHDPATFCWNGCPSVRAFQLNADKSAATYSSHDSELGSWALEGTRRIVNLPQPSSYPTSSFADCDGDGEPVEEVTGIISVVEYQLVQLSENALAITAISRVDHNDCPQDAQHTRASTYVSELLGDEQWDIGESELSDRFWVLPVFNPDYSKQTRFPRAIVDDVLELRADGSSTLRIGTGAPNWRVENGRLLLEQTGEYGGTIRRVRPVDDVGALYIGEYQRGSERYIRASFGFPVDPLASFVASDVPGRYFVNGIGKGPDSRTGQAADSRLEGYRFRFDPDGNGELEYDAIYNDEVIVASSFAKVIGWSVDEQGDIVYSRYTDLSPDGFGDFCADTDAPDCEKVADTRILMAQRVGERIYALRRRDEFNGFSFGNDGRFIQHAIVFDYRLLTPP